jgi:NADH dehydrogenase [ubiquinone] 1 alpha subcomplex assembly factor 6
MVETELSYCARLLRQQDPDRYLTALFAPAERREALFALYAFNLELARARESVREPIMGQMRLQWWRDSLAEILAGRPRAHEVGRPLAAAIAAHGLDPALLERLIDARERDMEAEPPADLAALLDYARGTSSTLTELALEVLGRPGTAVREAGRALGIAWALLGLVRAVPFHAAQRRLYLPASLTGEAGLRPGQLFDRGSSPELRQVARRLAEEAAGWLAAAVEAGAAASHLGPGPSEAPCRRRLRPFRCPGAAGPARSDLGSGAAAADRRLLRRGVLLRCGKIGRHPSRSRNGRARSGAIPFENEIGCGRGGFFFFRDSWLER